MDIGHSEYELMLAETLRAPAYRAYRLGLEASLGIPIDASELEVHERIAAGFTIGTAKLFCDSDFFTAEIFSQIVPLNALLTRLPRAQLLTPGESDHLFRLAHVLTMTKVLFGDARKAQRWLCKPKQRFAGKQPISLLCTSQGTSLVEELLIQIADGLAL